MSRSEIADPKSYRKAEWKGRADGIEWCVGLSVGGQFEGPSGEVRAEKANPRKPIRGEPDSCAEEVSLERLLVEAPAKCDADRGVNQL